MYFQVKGSLYKHGFENRGILCTQSAGPSTMNFFSRAGLVVTFILFIAPLGTAAPIPSNNHRLISLSSCLLSPSTRQASILDLNMARCPDNSMPSGQSGVSTLDDSDTVILVRRKSIFTKIKEGFQVRLV